MKQPPLESSDGALDPIQAIYFAWPKRRDFRSSRVKFYLITATTLQLQITAIDIISEAPRLKVGAS